ncbi:hypothetical protein ES695_02195 [Candidatus Atribacteria bacterium 1244-E10-H5-B2]|nr:MAG: hypothetical protein ES695_02195 [Candidatus Atribacteria bacterium 1244-E10-H5-B2]
MGKETEGQKYKRLDAEYEKLLLSSNTDMDLIEKRREELEEIENTFVNRNLEGKELEKAGKIDEAIALYEKNIKEEFDGKHPYIRLAIIYRKRKLFDDEARVLNKLKDLKMNKKGD